MPIYLEMIRFNHEDSSATTDAMSVRVDNDRALPHASEWLRGATVNPDHSVAAYAIESTSGQQLTIKAEFSTDDPWRYNHSAKVRAINFGHNNIGILGCVAATNITFDRQGRSGEVFLNLDRPRISDDGVGIYNLSWCWEYEDGIRWQQFGSSVHKIYVTVALPSAPWSQTADDRLLPWISALEVACAWAAGAKDKAEAATKITRHLNEVGGTSLRYDIANERPTFVKHRDLLLSRFLSILNMKSVFVVNCSDCAALVSTFANLLGCDLAQASMGNYFEINPVVFIGFLDWLPQQGNHNWSFHEVAWGGSMTASEPVYDACLQLGSGSRPQVYDPFQPPLLPVGMQFSLQGQVSYQDRLATPATVTACIPKRYDWRRDVY